MQQTLALIRVSLEASADPMHRDGMTSYFKESVHPLGVRSKEMTRITASTWRRISGWDKADILALCDRLWEAGSFEEGSLACKLSARLGKRLTEADFSRFETWMNTHVSNWAHCDDLGTHAIGTCLLAFPALAQSMIPWTASKNRWMRRGALVSLVYPLRKGMFLDHALQMVDTLITDPDDLVQKGVGWTLKEGTRLHEEQVFQFIMTNKNRLSRIALRTAIEKLPDELKQRAMKKEEASHHLFIDVPMR